jgi:hypothetical protein
MEMRILVAMSLLLSAAAALAQPAAPPPSHPPAKTLSVSQLREDLGRLRFTLEHAHPNLHRYTARPAMDALFDSIGARLNRPLTDLEFYRRLFPLVDAIRDSHTSLQLPPDLRRYFGGGTRPVFPLDLYFSDGRVLVEADFSDRPLVAPGAEVLSIDGRPMAEIARALAAGIAIDGFAPDTRASRLGRLFWFYYGTLFPDSGRYAVTVRDPRTGRVATHRIEGVARARLTERDARRRGAAGAAQRLELAGDGIAIVTLDEMSDPNTGTFLRGAFERIAAAGATDLVIDLRNCPGGDDKFNNQLFSYLVDGPFRFYRNRDFIATSYGDLRYVDYSLDDFITPEQAALLPAGQRERPLEALTLPRLLSYMLSVDGGDGTFNPAPSFRFTGRLYWLIGPESSSSAAEIAVLAHHLGLGTIVGGEPNGVYQGLTAGAIPVLTLPNSRIGMRIPLVAYHNAVMPGLFPGRSAPPAFPVAQTFADAVAGIDTVMVFTRRLIDERRLRPYPAPGTPPG